MRKTTRHRLFMIGYSGRYSGCVRSGRVSELPATPSVDVARDVAGEAAIDAAGEAAIDVAGEAAVDAAAGRLRRLRRRRRRGDGALSGWRTRCVGPSR